MTWCSYCRSATCRYGITQFDNATLNRFADAVRDGPTGRSGQVGCAGTPGPETHDSLMAKLDDRLADMRRCAGAVEAVALALKEFHQRRIDGTNPPKEHPHGQSSSTT